MTARLPPRGVVALTSLDLRRRPDHRSEMRSQLLLGEVVRPLAASKDGRWWRVENLSDGYPGWVRTWGLVPASGARAARWLARARTRFIAPFGAVLAQPAAGALVSPLVWNARVIAGKRRGSQRAVELPDGRRGWVAAAALAPVGARPPDLFERVRGLLGCPYLWGGRTPFGFDCSGFVQQLWFEQGIALPRDAEEQHRACDRLPDLESAAPGDLVFFGPPRGRIVHVGIVLGGGYFAHSRGHVRVGSMIPGNPLWEKDLSDQLRGCGRPRERARAARRRSGRGESA